MKKNTRTKVGLSRPQLKIEWYALVPNEALQTAYDTLLLLEKRILTPTATRLAAGTFLSLTEELVERFSPPFRGGQKWDGRKPREEEWR